MHIIIPSKLILKILTEKERKLAKEKEEEEKNPDKKKVSTVKLRGVYDMFDRFAVNCSDSNQSSLIVL